MPTHRVRLSVAASAECDGHLPPDRPQGGGAGTRTTAWPGWSTAPAGPDPALTRRRPGSSGGSWRCAAKLGPARLAGTWASPRRRVHRVLVRHGVNRLAWMDRPAGRVIRRIPTTHCGELVHIDVKKLARVPNGGGHRMHGRAGTSNGSMSKRGLGYTHVHTAIDAHARLAYSEFAGTENTANCVAFLLRAVAWFAARGITSSGSSPTTGTATAATPGSFSAPSSASATPAPYLPPRHQWQG